MQKTFVSNGMHDIKELLVFSEVVMRIFLIIAIAWLLYSMGSKAIKVLKTYLRSHANNNLEDLKRIETLCQVFRYILAVVLGVIAGMEILNELGISIAPILATAGVVGVAIGFGAQSLIKDYFNGFFLLLENQIRQGDVVEVAGKGGLVEEVTLRYIKMRDYDGNVHFIPNGTISTVTNMSRGFAYSVIDIRVDFREDLDKVMNVMRQVGDEIRSDKVFALKIIDTMEMAGVDKWEGAAITMRCRFKVLPLEQWDVRREYLKRIKHAFSVQHIEIPTPSMDCVITM